MIAAVLTRINEPLELAEVKPGTLAYGQVLVKVLASGICGAQLQEIRGEKGNAAHLPHLLGHEGVGIVEEIGAGVTRMQPGERVVMHWRKASGIESEFPTYRFRGKTMTSGRVITFAEQAICSENRLTPVADDAPLELCALLGCGLSTALATVENEANVRFGESVMVIGCGGLGTNLIRACVMRCAHPIVSVDINSNKSAIAYHAGANLYLDCTANEWSEIPALAKVKGFDVIIDTAGSPSSMEKALTFLKPSGRYIMVGQPRPGESVALLNARHLFDGEGKSIRATQGGQFRPDVDIPRYVELWRSGLLNLDGLITHRLPLAKINDGIELVRAGEAGRVLIEMQQA